MDIKVIKVIKVFKDDEKQKEEEEGKEEEDACSTLSLPSPSITPRSSDVMRRRAALLDEQDPVVPLLSELTLEDLSDSDDDDAKQVKDILEEDEERRRKMVAGRLPDMHLPPRAPPTVQVLHQALPEVAADMDRVELVHVRARDVEMRLEGASLAAEVSRLLNQAAGYDLGVGHSTLATGGPRPPSPAVSRATSRAASPTRWLDRHLGVMGRAGSSGGNTLPSSPRGGADGGGHPLPSSPRDGLVPPWAQAERVDSDASPESAERIDIEELMRLPNDEMLQAMGTLVSTRFTMRNERTSHHSDSSSGEDQRPGPIPSLRRAKPSSGSSDDQQLRRLSSDNLDRIGDSYIMRGFNRRSQILGASTSRVHVMDAVTASVLGVPPLDAMSTSDVESGTSTPRAPQPWSILTPPGAQSFAAGSRTDGKTKPKAIGENLYC